MPAPASLTGQPEVLVLLAVHNGARWLEAQLDSLAAQQGVTWRLLASDDASTDGSRALLARFAQAHPGRVQVIEGPGRGSTANFRHLIARIPEGAGHVSFCDQDDVWLPDKLARAVAMLAGEAAPALYASRTVVVDEGLGRICDSALPRRPPSFRNALVQNIASGNTMVLNPAAAALARLAVAEAGDAMTVHDWWAYQLVTGVGGRVLFDPRPSLLYRQHASNAIGAGVGAGALRRRVQRLASGVVRDWHAATCRALGASAHRLTEENRQVLALYRDALKDGPAARIRALRRAGVYRQTRIGSLAFWLGALFGRV